MKKTNKRNDVQDILKIIRQMDASDEFITTNSIGKHLNQTGANIHRILKTFDIDLKPYQKRFRLERQASKVSLKNQNKQSMDRLKKLNTAKHSLTEIARMIDFKGTAAELKTLLVHNIIPFKTKIWFTHYLKSQDTSNLTMRELFKKCRLNEDEISYGTFRTRLYENAIPYKSKSTAPKWWNELSHIDRQVPTKARDDLKTFFDLCHINTTDYTLKELFGYFDFNMTYLSFKKLMKAQDIQTK